MVKKVNAKEAAEVQVPAVNLEAEKQKLDALKKKEALIEEVNKGARYDVARAFGALNAALVSEEATMDFEMFKCRVDMATMADVVVFGCGGRINSNTVAMLMNVALAYGWHWATEGESLVRGKKVRENIEEFLNSNSSLTVNERLKRKRAMEQGFEALAMAVEKIEAKMKIARTMEIKK